MSLLPDPHDLASAEIVFLPYNYLLDPDTRTNTLAEINWSNAVVIFDEAHNLESFASESASFDLTGVDLGGCIGEVQRAISFMQTMPEMAAEIGSGRCVRGMLCLHLFMYLRAGMNVCVRWTLMCFLCVCI